MKITHKTIIKILREGRFDNLRGLSEDEFLDVKKLPYECDETSKITDAGKFELAKDVSSFANAKGGIILIGVSTEQPELESTKESINGFTYLSISAINSTSYRDILNRLTYPKLGERVEITKFKLTDKPDKCIVAIYIPSQPNKEKNFVVSGILEKNKLSTGRFVGIFKRQGDSSSSFLSTTEIYYALKKDSETKALLKNINEEFKTLHNKLDELTSSIKQGQDIAKQTMPAQENIEKEEIMVSDSIHKDRIEDSLTDGDFGDQPVLILSCNFKGDKPIQVPNLFNPIEGSPYKLVENPPAFREFGWDLKTLDQPKSVEGDCLQVRNGDRKLLRVYRDGQIIFIALATETFLGWGTKNRNVLASTVESIPEDTLILNTLAVAEVITNFSQFIEILRVHLLPIPQDVEIKLQIRNPEEKKMKLMWVSMFNEITGEFAKDSKNKELKLHFPDNLSIDFKKISANLFSEFCYIFGVTDQDIRYLVDSDGEKIIDMARFKNK